MFELFIAALGIGLLLLYIFINSKSIAYRLLGKALMGDTKRKRSRVYLERFRVYKQKKRGGSNIVIQILPWLGVIALFFILINQYIYLGTVLSGSMEPMFKKGDLVLMQSIDKQPNIGDIIMFSTIANKEPITHRIIRITPSGGIITKGDNNSVEDSWTLTKYNIIGKAVTIGKKPLALKGLGSILVPEAGDFTIMREPTTNSQILMLFQRFRVLQPFILLFITILYFYAIIETRKEEDRMVKRNGKR